jgi:hypothetical protein
MLIKYKYIIDITHKLFETEKYEYKELNVKTLILGEKNVK